MLRMLRDLMRRRERRRSAAREAKTVAAWRAVVRSLRDEVPEPDELVLMWHYLDGWSVQDFDHDSDAAWWLERGYTCWAPLPPPADTSLALTADELRDPRGQGCLEA